ncbi:MAG: transketolase [Planctomycetes bacterium]|nr:transketolase [Planctomycetota bacterium]
MADVKQLNGKIVKLGKQTIKMCTVAGSGHPSSGLSLLHITTALMYRVMRYDPADPWNKAADRLVLSEGHAVPVVYAAYCELNGAVGAPDRPRVLKYADALSLRDGDSVLDGHPNPVEGFPFFDAATGSLGQGLSVAAGLAAAARLDGLDRKFYCLIGDGESREGQIAEAIDFIVDHKLTAVRMIFNCNGQGQSDYVSQQQSAETLTKKLEAFGCEVKVIDGHNFAEILPALEAEAGDKPMAIVAKTVKGWGCKKLQSGNYHGKPLTIEQLEEGIADFDNIAKELGVSDLDDSVTPPLAKSAAFQGCKSGGEIKIALFDEGLKAAGMAKQLEGKKLATRRAYGAALLALGAADERVTALDGDVKNSTFAEIFAKQYPERFYECRIAEQNMISAGVGMAAGGKIPFVSSFAKFLSRGYDQLELAAITNANLKICGSHAGISLAADGPSQMSLPDVAYMRSMARAQRHDGAPTVRVMLPSDAVSTYKLTELMANLEGICYMRTHRPDVAFLYDESETFMVGGFKQLAEGCDLLIVASGYMVHVALEALPILKEKKNISAGLIDAYSLPLETDGILKAASEQGGRILVVEDNYVGGVADEIASAVACGGGDITVNSLYVKKIPKSTRSTGETMKMAGLSAEDIVAAAGAKECACRG